jgi:SAM-dependent methyltransferase
MPEDIFEYKGFRIPTALVFRTGGAPEAFDGLAQHHMAKLDRYIGLQPNVNVVEIGCGIGRDAIPLTEVLAGPEASYLGTDVIKESIDWCSANITPKFPRFTFVHHDISDTLHNPAGTQSASDIKLPVSDASTDIIILQSVFTHMFEPEIVHYLKEFRRILRPDGRVWASMFIVNDEVRKHVAIHSPTVWELSFRHEHGPGCCISSMEEKRSAVAFTREAVDRMLSLSGLKLSVPPIRGAWSGYWSDADFGQDAVVLMPA